MPQRLRGCSAERITDDSPITGKRFFRRVPGVLSAVCLLVVFSSCGTNEGVSVDPGELPDTVSRGFRQVTVSENGRVEIESEMVEVYNKKNLSVFTLASLQEFDARGELSLNGRADRIELTGNRNGSAEGGIRLHDIPENSTLEAEKLIWDNKERMLKGEGPVRVETGDGLKLQGAGFIADLARETYRFRSGVSGSLVVEDE